MTVFGLAALVLPPVDSGVAGLGCPLPQGMARRDARTKEWSLFVDESGDFADPLDEVAVAGLLLPANSILLDAAALRRALTHAMPWAPWPIHAGWLNQAGYAALVMHASMDALPADIGEAVRRAFGTLAVVFPEVRGLAGEDLDRRVKGELRKLTYSLRERDRLAYDVIRRHVRDGWAALLRVVAALASQDTVFLAACGETFRGEAAASADRYCELLGALMERVRDVLDRDTGLHRVLVKVQDRHVYDPRFRTRVDLSPPQLSAVLNREAPRTADVQLLAAEVTRYNASVDPAHVLADIISNLVRRSLTDVNSGLADLEHRISLSFPGRVRSGTPALPHLASTGEARHLANRLLPAGVHPEQELPCVPPRRRWACEQAWQWAEWRFR